MAALPVLVHAAADAAFGTVSRRDLVALGFAPSTIDDWASVGALERTGRGEYRVPGSGHATTQRLATMLWRAGEGARLAGGLACGLRGLKGFSEEEPAYIAVPSRRRVRAVDFTVVRTPIPVEDQDLILGLPGVTVERGLIGAAAMYRRARVRLAYYDAKFRGIVSEESLTERTVALGRRHGAPQMRAILETGAMKVESPQEWGLAGIFQPADERPVEQVWVEWHGKWHRLDFAYLDARLALEYDGQSHEDTREQDADRDLALMELNIQTIRVTKAMMANPSDTRRRILAVRAQRMAMGLPPLVPRLPPWK